MLAALQPVAEHPHLGLESSHLLTARGQLCMLRLQTRRRGCGSEDSHNRYRDGTDDVQRRMT